MDRSAPWLRARSPIHRIGLNGQRLFSMTDMNPSTPDANTPQASPKDSSTGCMPLALLLLACIVAFAIVCFFFGNW